MVTEAVTGGSEEAVEAADTQTFQGGQSSGSKCQAYPLLAAGRYLFYNLNYGVNLLLLVNLQVLLLVSLQVLVLVLIYTMTQ